MTLEIDDDPSAAALDLENENYDSAEDSDFQLDDDDDEDADVAGDDSGLSSSDEDQDQDQEQEGGGGIDSNRPTKKRKLNISQKDALKKRKRKGRDEDHQMDLDSGDEATILRARNTKDKNNKKKKKQKKTSTEDQDAEDEDMDIEFSDNDEAGFVKTRSMRLKIQEDQRPLAKIDGATIDVDALWAKMNAPDTDSGILQSQKKPSTTTDPEHQPSQDKETEKPTDGETTTTTTTTRETEDMIKIKRTYKFAGEIHTEEKLVPRHSAEAKLYLAETNGETTTATGEPQDETTVIIKLRRPLRKMSRFDPNPSGVIKKSWEKQPLQAILGGGDDLKGPKLNTVEKSRLDWAQYVDEAGIKDELNVHSKAKEGYMGRMDFLGRVDAKREEERRTIRLKGL